MVSKVEIAETAVHPGDPAHFEGAEFKLHPACVACLLQLGTTVAVTGTLESATITRP